MVAVVGSGLGVLEHGLIAETDAEDLAEDLGGFAGGKSKGDVEGQDQTEDIGRAVQASQVEARAVEGGGSKLGRAEMILAILIAELELGETEFLQVVRAAILRALVNRAVRALLPSVQGAVAVRAPVRGLAGTMAGSQLRQTPTDFTAQLGGPATIVEIEVRRRCSAMGTTGGRRNRMGASTLGRSQGPTVGFLGGGAQLLPVERGLRSTQGRRLSEGSLGVDVETAVMRMLLAKVIARSDLRLALGKNLLKLTDEVLQFSAGKFLTKPKHKACYFVHGGWSPRHRASSLNEDSRMETQPLFTSSVKPYSALPSSSPKLWKLTRYGNRGKIKEPKRFSHRFHSAWKTLRKRRSEFPTVPTASAASSSIKNPTTLRSRTLCPRGEKG